MERELCCEVYGWIPQFAYLHCIGGVFLGFACRMSGLEGLVFFLFF